MTDPIEEFLAGCLRHVKVKTVEEANQPALKRLVEAAWEDAQAHLKKKA